MKYVYAVLILALCIGGIFFFVSQQKQEAAVEDEVPVGFHRMGDGTLMENSTTMETKDTSVQSEAVQNPNQAQVLLDPNAKVFTVKGVNYGYDVTEIRAKKGETVTINFESTDGFHDWVLDEFDARTTKVSPGTPTSVTFVAGEAGTFEYYCSVGSHRQHGMVGKLIVE